LAFDSTRPGAWLFLFVWFGRELNGERGEQNTDERRRAARRRGQQYGFFTIFNQLFPQLAREFLGDT
jgi:hypothetical protein